MSRLRKGTWALGLKKHFYIVSFVVSYMYLDETMYDFHLWNMHHTSVRSDDLLSLRHLDFRLGNHGL